MPEKPSAFFDDVAVALLAQPGVSPGTMMGFPCLRIDGEFFASCDHRTFREWVLVEDRDATRWAALMAEARLFVSGRQ